MAYSEVTTDPAEAPLFRITIEASVQNGPNEQSSLMVDKLTTERRVRLGERIGRLVDEDAVRLDRAVVVFLDLAG